MLAFIVLQDDISMGTIVELKGLVSHTIKISYIYRDDSGDYRAAWNYLGGNAVPDIRIYGTGYSLRTIQKCLKGVTTVSDFKSNIKENAPRGVTDRKIDMFFKTFEDRWNI